MVDSTPTRSRQYLDALLPADTATHGLALVGCGAYTAVRASLWGTDLPDIGLFNGDKAVPGFDLSGEDAAVRHLYGVDLNGAS